MTDPATLKNDTQRQEWLRNYRDWGIWYTDEHIGATYYKYTFQNGAELISEEYTSPLDVRGGPYIDHYFHLIGGPKVTHGKWIYHDYYCHCVDSITYLVNFLKATKGGTQ